MKKVLKMIGVLLGIIICMGVVILVVFNITAPLKIQGKIEVMVEEYDEVSLEIMQEMYEDIDEEDDWIRFYDKMPSNQQEDYTRVIVSANVKNRSFFRQDGIFANLHKVPQEEKVLCQENRIKTGFVHHLEEKDITLFYFTMYTKGMTREEIKEYIKDLKLDVYFGSDIRRDNHMTVSLKNVNWEEE